MTTTFLFSYQCIMKPLKTGNELFFSVSDDGMGFPDGFNPEKTESMGLKIVNVLARQLEGQLTFECVKGTRICLRMIL